MSLQTAALVAWGVFLVWCARRDNPAPHPTRPPQDDEINLSRWAHDGTQPATWSVYG